jgi:hypothetical protein
MSQSVEIDASKGVEKSAADVFLGVFWSYAVKTEISFREFKDLVETWHRIRDMETLVESIDYKELYNNLVDSLLEPEAPDEPGEVQIDQHTFVSEADAEAEIAAMKETPHPPAEPAPSPQGEGNGEPKPGSWARFRSDRKFKQAVTERIREARKMGIGSETIAQNTKGQGVTGDTIRQILNAQPVDVRKYRKIDEALDRLGVPKQEEDNEQEG